jgi:hypothetical protein
MSQHGTQQETSPNVGYVLSCIDRRFVEVTRRKFEALTGFPGTGYYHEAFAGGALGEPPPVNGARYVYDRSFEGDKDINLVVMCWQAHLDHCGGLPGESNALIRERFQARINEQFFQKLFPRVQTHIFLLASLDREGQPVAEVLLPK